MANPTPSTSSPLNLGWIPYWNLHPLHAELANRWGDRLNVRTGHPTTVNSLLGQGAVDLAPCSSVCLLLNSRVEMALPLGVTALGPVQSVYLGLRQARPDLLESISARHRIIREIVQYARSRTDADIRVTASIIWDKCRELGPIGLPLPPLKLCSASASSAVLAKIVYNFWFFGDAAERALVLGQASGQGSPLFEDAPLELVIGDEALIRRPQYAQVIDLGSTWFDMTGLPFVYAVWQCLRSRPLPSPWAQRISECAALAEATMRVEPTNYIRSDTSPVTSSGTPVDLAAYWQCIQYRLQPTQLKGLLLFLALARYVTQQETHADVVVRMMRWSDEAARQDPFMS